MSEGVQPRRAPVSVPLGAAQPDAPEAANRAEYLDSGPSLASSRELSAVLERQCRLGPAEAGVVFGWSAVTSAACVRAIVQPRVGREGTWLERAQDLATRLHGSRPSEGTANWVFVKGEGSGKGDLYDPRGPVHMLARRLASVRVGGGSTPDEVSVFAVRARQSELETIAERLDAVWGESESAAAHEALTEVQGRLATASEVLDISGTLAEQTGFRGMATALCDTLAARLGCERASLGLATGRGRGRHVRVRALSHTEKLLVGGSQVTQDIELAMEECLDQNADVWVPYAETAAFVARSAIELSRRAGHGAVVSLPIRTPRTVDDDPVVYVPGMTDEPGRGAALLPRGVLTLERAGARPFTAAEVELVRVLLDLSAPRLWLLAERDRWIGARAATTARRALAVLLGPHHTWLKLAAILLLGAIAFLTLVRGTYRVEASFRVEAVRRQVLPAPYDGYLREVFTRIGESVQAGAVLARLDDTQLRLQVSEARAELAAYSKEASVARDQGKTAEEQIARAQAQRVEARIDLLDQQIAQSKLVAPITGVVVAGDLERMLGAPVQTGQVLFELAPLDALHAELLVGEDQIGDVQVGQVGKLATAALPAERLAFRIERIDPIAEVAEQRNVFRVRASLDAPADWMRPGMEGVARIDVDQRRYPWIWTRRLMNWARMKLWM